MPSINDISPDNPDPNEAIGSNPFYDIRLHGPSRNPFMDEDIGLIAQRLEQPYELEWSNHHVDIVEFNNTDSVNAEVGSEGLTSITHRYFGARVIEYAKNTIFDDIPYYMSENFVALRERLKLKHISDARNKLIQLADNPVINECLATYPIPDSLRRDIVENDDSRHVLIENLIGADDEILERFIVWNHQYTEKMNTIYHYRSGNWDGKSEEGSYEGNEHLAAIVDEFKDSLFYAIEHQNLPISREVVGKRLRDINIEYGDILQGHSEEVAGLYEHGQRSIAIFGDVTVNKSLRKTIFHELLHQISGQFGVVQDIDFAQVLKCGMGYNEHTAWMNEAITEELAQMLLSENPDPNFDYRNVKWHDEGVVPQGGTYRAERKLLRTMVGGHEALGGEVTFGDFLDAYFEDDPNSQPGAINLYKKLSARFGNGVETILRLAVSDPNLAANKILSINQALREVVGVFLKI